MRSGDFLRLDRPRRGNRVWAARDREELRVPWICTFADEFDGSALDLGNWQAMTTATMGFSQFGECYVDDPSHISVADGLLTLVATKLPIPAPCGPTTSPFQSAMIFTEHRFAQTYGRFEVRAKLPEGPGLQPAIWMYPQDMAYGDRSGEIDIAESFGAPDVVSPTFTCTTRTGSTDPWAPTAV